MNAKVNKYRFQAKLPIILITLGILGCGSNDRHSPINDSDAVICVVLAHPDDETIIGGTLSMLTEQGCAITLIYITSGDDGPDMTGRGLYGSALGEVRENEVKQALGALGIKNPPIFLRFPDGHIYDYVDSITDTLSILFERISPQIVISFGPDGVTGSIDHKYTGSATDLAFAISDSCRLLLHMAVTKPLSPFYAHGVAVPKDSVNIRVNVSKYSNQRIHAVEAHHTQFNRKVLSAYKVYVHTMRKEKFIIAGNRGNNEWLEKCF